jgi:hypothetical protein
MSSPLVTQFRRGGVSRDVRLTAASGALPLSPSDQVELLFLLTRDRDEEVSQQAESSLQALEDSSIVSVVKEENTSVDVLVFFGLRVSSEDVQQALLRNASTPDETVAILVPKLSEMNLEFVVVNQTRLLRHNPIIAALEANENLNTDQGRRIKELKFDFRLDRPAEDEPVAAPPQEAEPARKLDLATGPAEDEKPPPTSTEEAAQLYGVTDEELEGSEEEVAKRKSLLAELVTMSAAQKMMKALKGEREARLMLIRDRNRTVWSAVLSSPKMNDNDAEQISKMRNVAPDVLREIAKNRQWSKRYDVAHELVKNPKTPHEVSSKLLARLKDRDLKRLVKDRNVSEQVRRLAEKRTRVSK